MMIAGRSGNFGTMKRWLIGVSGVGMAFASVLLSKQGVGISGELAWIGTIVAVSLFCAELMFNSNFDELNWTILVLGLCAYTYSIWTNVQGFYFYRGVDGTLFTNFDVTSVFGGVFMDVYPELAIAWAVGESKLGDLIGNVVKTSKNPDKLTNAISSTQAGYKTTPNKVPTNQRKQQLEQQYRPDDSVSTSQKSAYTKPTGYNNPSLPYARVGLDKPSTPRPTFHAMSMNRSDMDDDDMFIRPTGD